MPRAGPWSDRARSEPRRKPAVHADIQAAESGVRYSRSCSLRFESDPKLRARLALPRVPWSSSNRRRKAVRYGGQGNSSGRSTMFLQIRGTEKDLGGGFRVSRLLPAVACRAVGPFVFLDHFGPVSFQPGMKFD